MIFLWLGMRQKHVKTLVQAVTFRPRIHGEGSWFSRPRPAHAALVCLAKRWGQTKWPFWSFHMFTLWWTNIAMENGHLLWIFPLKMVIFHCYVSSPEGNMFNGYNELETHICSWVNQPFMAFLMEHQVSILTVCYWTWAIEIVDFYPWIAWWFSIVM